MVYNSKQTAASAKAEGGKPNLLRFALLNLSEPRGGFVLQRFVFCILHNGILPEDHVKRERGGECACACACVCWAIQQIRVVARSVQGHRPCVRRSFRSSWSTRQAAACTGTSHPSVLTKHTKSTQRAPCRNGRSETRGEHSLHMFVGGCVCVCLSVCLSVCVCVCV